MPIKNKSKLKNYPNYPNLNKLAKEVAKRTISEINLIPFYVKDIDNDTTPYRRQYILEEVIRILQESV
jgi:hypothetical protein